jgi:hypothetical protein
MNPTDLTSLDGATSGEHVTIVLPAKNEAKSEAGPRGLAR